MEIIENQKVKDSFSNYPKPVRNKLAFLRQLVFETASEIDSIEVLEETFKWGEASYVTKNGSTIRMDWKPKNPDQYCLYFNCKTKLVDTFKELYKDTFKFDGNRAIIFNSDEEIPIIELQHCIRLSLTYHKIKNIPLLGA